MAWTAPITWVAGAVPTAAILNAQIRDNLLETMPAKATRDGSIFVGNGANRIIERFVDMATVHVSETTSSTSYTNVATVGPSVTVTTGTTALVFHSGHLSNNTTDGYSYMSWAVSGATTRAAMDSIAIINGAVSATQIASGGMLDLITTLTPGSNTFTAKYRVDTGTGTFHRRILGVIPLS